MDRITILGMGPLGVSIGLGLKKARLKDTEVLGTDGDSKALKRAEEMGAIDTANSNLRSSMHGASLVIVDTPHSETREFLEAIGPALGQDTTVTDTGSAKVQVSEWAKQYLPHDATYVGGRPLPRHTMHTLDDVVPDALDGAGYCVVAESSARPDSVRTVAGLVEAVGAKPVFMSPEEHDSYAAATSHLPIALSAAMVTALSASPGWRDMAKVVGSEFSDVSRLAALDPEDNAIAFDGTSDSLVHWLDRVISELTIYRDQVEAGGDEIMETLINGWEQLARLESGAAAEEESFGPPGPTMGQAIGGMIVGRRITDRAKQFTELNKDAPWRYPRRRHG